ADAYSGVAPDVDIISIRQSSQAFGLKDAYTGDEDPQSAAKITSIDTMAKAIVHAANLGASVINISDVTCMSARNIIDQRTLGVGRQNRRHRGRGRRQRQAGLQADPESCSLAAQRSSHLGRGHHGGDAR